MQTGSEKFTHDAVAIRDHALQAIATSPARITPSVLEKMLIDRFGLNRNQIKSVIRNLVSSGLLTYTYEFGSTFLEQSFAKPVRISKHIVLQPPGLQTGSNSDDVVVRIKPGAAFGAGNHPTTRLAIQAIEFILFGRQASVVRRGGNVLDIGTGSGVLLISAVLCGLKTGLGIDIDACARAEAAENVKTNGLEDRIVISGQSVAEIGQRFALIIANLRYPSLEKILFEIDELAAATCFLVLSGIRDYELDDLVNTYKKIKFEKMWAENELDWYGAVLRRV